MTPPGPSTDENLLADYRQLTAGAGLVDLGPRALIELTGEDRASFLHNLCTNEIRRLEAGQSCEAFVCDVRGKILFYVDVVSLADSLVLETVAPEAERLLAHLDRYLIRERVELHNRSQAWAQLLVAGDRAGNVIGSTGAEVPPERNRVAATRLANVDLLIRAVDWLVPDAYLVQSAAENLPSVRDALIHAGAVVFGKPALEAARIEAGTPLAGVDITSDNLPQEVARDERAISFVKGCYLGQETVARIDALGHVNKTLVGVQFTGSQVPEQGTELTADDRVVGHVTSAALSPKLGTALALAYIRRGSNQPGIVLSSPLGSCTTVGLPV